MRYCVANGIPYQTNQHHSILYVDVLCGLYHVRIFEKVKNDLMQNTVSLLEFANQVQSLMEEFDLSGQTFITNTTVARHSSDKSTLTIKFMVSIFTGRGNDIIQFDATSPELAIEKCRCELSDRLNLQTVDEITVSA